MPTPPRPIPRAAFIAALAAAGAFSLLPMRAKRQAPPAFRAERRDRSIRQIARFVGRAIIAAGRAQEEFEERGAKLWQAPAAIIDPRVRAIMACPAFVRALGRPAALDDGEAPCWVEVRDEPPRVQIFWRGAFVDDRDAFAQAVAAAVAALNGAGFATSSFLEVRKHKVGARGYEPSAVSFEGLVATIGLRRPMPSR